MDKYNVTLGIYYHYKDGRTVWLQDVEKLDNKLILHLIEIDHFLPGLHSFKSDNMSHQSQEPFEKFFSFVYHKNKEIEKWTLAGRVVPQGNFFQII